MNVDTETNSDEILLIDSSWFLLKKKTRTCRNLPKNRKKVSMNVHRNQFKKTHAARNLPRKCHGNTYLL